MKTMLALALAAGVAIAAAAPAAARDGCGGGFHRGPAGHCRPNRGGYIVAPGRPVIGVYYGNRGYWDGRRYYQRRYRHHGDWRYR